MPRSNPECQAVECFSFPTRNAVQKSTLLEESLLLLPMKGVIPTPDIAKIFIRHLTLRTKNALHSTDVL